MSFFEILVDSIMLLAIIQEALPTIEKAIEESKKCVLLCSNCHKEFHAGLWNLNELDFNEMEEVKLDSNP